MLEVKFDKRCANNTKNNKIIREEKKTSVNGEIHCIHGLEDSVLLSFQFSPNKCTDSISSQSKSQQIYCRN